MSENTPDGWNITTLGDLGEFATSSVDKKRQPGEQVVRLVNYMDVYRNRYLDSSMNLMTVTASRSEVEKARVEAGDMFFTPSSETPDDIGHSAVFVDEPVDTLHSYHTVRFRLHDPKCLDIRFRGRLANSRSVLKHFSLLATGSTRYTLSLGDFRLAPINIPPIREQTKIAKTLDTLDTAIHETEAIIAKLKAVKQGLLHDLLTRGIDTNGELRPPQAEAPHLYKESALGWIPKEWSVLPLGHMAEVSRGKFTHRPRNDPRFYGGKHPFIQTGDVAAAGGECVSTFSQTLSDRGTSVSHEFPVGTIAITIAANIADTAILAIPMFFPDSVVGAVVDSTHNVRFVELSIRKAKPGLDARAPQSAQKNINLQDLRPLPLAVPCREEQDEIAGRYEALQSRLQFEIEGLHKCRQQRAGLMDDLLTGRVRVTALLSEAEPQTECA